MNADCIKSIVSSERWNISVALKYMQIQAHLLGGENCTPGLLGSCIVWEELKSGMCIVVSRMPRGTYERGDHSCTRGGGGAMGKNSSKAKDKEGEKK